MNITDVSQIQKQTKEPWCKPINGQHLANSQVASREAINGTL